MEDFLRFSNDNLWSELWPELTLALGAVLILLIQLFSNKAATNICGRLAVLFQVVLLGYLLLDYLLIHHTFDRSSFSGMLRHGFQGDLMRTFFLLASICVSILGNRFLLTNKLKTGEFHHLTMLATAGLMLLCQSANFIVLFVALETVALAFYPLVAFDRSSSKSLEAGIKYLIFGALSSSLLLLGIVLIYGVGSNPGAWGAISPSTNIGMDILSFEFVGLLLEANQTNLLLRSGVVLVLAGLAFKIGAAPFQIWVPDVYHGSPTPITAFLAVSSKAAGFFLLLNLVNGPFDSMSEFLLPLFGFIATFTILFGNLAACAQRKLKRMLGLSGVAHAGYLLVAVMASMHFAGDSDRAVWVIFFYLFIYLFASFIVFGVMGIATLKDDSDHEIGHYEGLLQKHPWAAISLLVGIASLAGIPPFGGFVAKLMLFNVAFEAKLYTSLVAMVIGVVISIYYYFGWIREICFEPKPHFDDDNEPIDPWTKMHQLGLLKLLIITFAVVSFVFGIWQGPFGDAF
ncbi:NADH-quinone oxidoreductase subunit N [Opitutales bacterium]|nr:NADH-quinone oxidoreductase subunit N [Opitutales bacterium]